MQVTPESFEEGFFVGAQSNPKRVQKNPPEKAHYKWSGAVARKCQ